MSYRASEQRAVDAEQAKKVVSSAAASASTYFTSLFNSKPAVPPTQA
jgi:hypothetical protein